MDQLTAFQRDVLFVIATEPKYGLAIKRELEEYYNHTVSHGRLYSSLDDLAENGVIDKREMDNRTNEYELADAGKKAIRERRQWETKYADDVIEGGADPQT